MSFYIYFLTAFMATTSTNQQSIFHSLGNRNIVDKITNEFNPHEKKFDLQMLGLNNLNNKKHGIKMGIPNDLCDNAKDNLETDWDNSPINYTCYYPKSPFPVLENIKSVEECEILPKDYIPKHHCMQKKLSYKDALPTHGDHRPLWPVFGEYVFVPPQRWLHNVEHGAVVMLYHPCTHPLIVDQLRSLVKNCIRKHIITTSTNLSPQRPLALISWGCRLLLNHVDIMEVISFIKKYALHGPEGTYSKEGQYTYKLLAKAIPPLGSNINDSNLCPNYS